MSNTPPLRPETKTLVAALEAMGRGAQPLAWALTHGCLNADEQRSYADHLTELAGLLHAHAAVADQADSAVVMSLVDRLPPPPPEASDATALEDLRDVTGALVAVLDRLRQQSPGACAPADPPEPPPPAA